MHAASNLSVYSSGTESDGTPLSSFTKPKSQSQSVMEEPKKRLATERRITKTDIVDPLMQSADKYANKKTNDYTKTKVYDYNVANKLIEDPYQVDTFREKNLSKYTLRVDSLRPQTSRNVMTTPHKVKTNRHLDLNSEGSTSSRKTVRFAESAEGLLKAVPVDPSFKDDEYMHDMKHIID